MTNVSERAEIEGRDAGGEDYRARAAGLGRAMIEAVRRNPGLRIGRFVAMPLLGQDGKTVNGAAFGWATHFGAQSLLVWERADGGLEAVSRQRRGHDAFDAQITESRFDLSEDGRDAEGFREFVDFSRDGCRIEYMKREEITPPLDGLVAGMSALSDGLPRVPETGSAAAAVEAEPVALPHPRSA